MALEWNRASPLIIDQFIYRTRTRLTKTALNLMNNSLEGVELQWWDGAATFKETVTAEDSMTTAIDWQDSLDDIGQEPGSVDRAVAAYDGDENDDLPTTDDENDSGDENDSEDENGRDGRVAGKASDTREKPECSELCQAGLKKQIHHRFLRK